VDRTDAPGPAQRSPSKNDLFQKCYFEETEISPVNDFRALRPHMVLIRPASTGANGGKYDNYQSSVILTMFYYFLPEVWKWLIEMEAAFG